MCLADRCRHGVDGWALSAASVLAWMEGAVGDRGRWPPGLAAWKGIAAVDGIRLGTARKQGYDQAVSLMETCLVLLPAPVTGSLEMLVTGLLKNVKKDLYI